MFKYILLSGFLLVQAVVLGCQPVGGRVTASLGNEFSLSVGQTAELTAEKLTLQFEGVQEDSRCPRGATCVWQGRVSCTVKINDNGAVSTIVLSEPGLTEQPGANVYRNYKFSSRVLPYPELNRKIATEDYRLFLTVTRLP
jgi:hypothetical protein